MSLGPSDYLPTPVDLRTCRAFAELDESPVGNMNIMLES